MLRKTEGTSLLTSQQEQKAKEKRSKFQFRVVLVAFLLFISIGALAVGIVALFHPNYNGDITHLQQTDVNITNDLNIANMHIDMLQSQLAELMMEQGNLTLVQNGTFIWGVSSREDSSFPFATCSHLTVSELTMVNAGTGYRVGDLITPLWSTPSAFIWSEHPVIRVDTIDTLTGAVLTYTILSTGCLDSGIASPLLDELETLSVVGSGFTVIMIGPLYTPSFLDAYYDYPTPPSTLASALQIAHYSIYELLVQDVAFTILYLDPPPIVMQMATYGLSSAIDTLQFNTYEFQPPVDEIRSLGTADYIFPITRKNLNAIVFNDQSNCWATKECFLNLNDVPRYDTLQAMQFKTFAQQFNQQFHSWIRFRIKPADPEMEFTSSSFTLSRPLMLVLPAL